MLTNLANSFNPSFQSSDYWIIQNSARAARPDLGLQEGEAARLALEELEKLKGSAAHRLSLVPVVHSLPELQSLFLNLDRYLFREVLKNNVSFRFSSDLHPKIHGSTSALGAFGNQIVVSLNSTLTSHPSHLALVASLIHQMAHAYLLVCCGFGASNADDERHDLKHGLAFSSIVHYIQDLLVDDAMIPLPDLFYCSDVLNRSTHLRCYHPGRQSLHSYCHFNLSDHEDKVACGAYMRHVKAAAKASSSDSSEKDLLPANISESTNTLGDLVNSAQLQSFYRLQANAYQFLQLPRPAPGPAGDIPASGDYQALINLQTFLAFGDYDPKIASGLDGSDLDGPPRIHADDRNKIKESTPTNPLHDLRTYILALRTSVEPLRRLALVRLYSQQLLRKEINAMHFLEEIYTGAPSGDNGPGDTVKDYNPDEDLRRFTQAFLCAAHPDLPTKVPGVVHLEYEDTIFGRRYISETDSEPVTKDNTNLHILQTTGKYKDRLSKLRGKGGLFLEDLDKVKSALDKKEPITAPDDLFRNGPERKALPAPDNGLANGLLGSRAILERLEAAEEQRRAHNLYQQYVRRRPVLGLGGIPAPVTMGDLEEARLEELDILNALRR